MGHKDLMSIFPIVEFARKLEKEMNWGYQWRWDQGSFETCIEIAPWGNGWTCSRMIEPEPLLRHGKIFVPDIIDFNNKVIIEYEETYTKRKKGHDPDGMDKRTSNRDEYYKFAGFKLFKIFDYEDEKAWKERLFRFLADCYCIAVLNRPK